MKHGLCILIGFALCMMSFIAGIRLHKHFMPDVDNAELYGSLAACEAELYMFYETGEPPYPCKIDGTCPSSNE